MIRRIVRGVLLVSCLAISTAFPSYAAERGDPDMLITESDKAYFLEIKTAIEKHDARWMANNVDLPMNIGINGKRKPIRTKKDFVKNYDDIINENIISAVQSQDANDLFKNWRGIMIGSGQMWILEYREDGSDIDKYVIIAINNCWDGKVDSCTGPHQKFPAVTN